MMYVARCKCGKAVFGAIANTPIEQAECASEIKSLTKKGFVVTLENPPNPLEWCDNKGRCK